MGPRVVVVHDYLSQRGGAERVVLAILGAFPGARLVTSVHSPERTFAAFADHEIETLWPDRVPAFRSDPRRALPVLAGAFSRHVIDDADVVVCSSSGWSHGIGSTAPKVVYCHTPARWLYEPADYLDTAGVAPRLATRVLQGRLKRWDRAQAATVSEYLANSTTVRDRIRRAYGREAQVLHPPVSLDAEGPQEEVPGVKPGFWLTVSRARAYKNANLVCEAIARRPDERLVAVGTLPPRQDGGTWPANVTAAKDLSEARLRWLYANCRAVVSASREDFGLSPVEGNEFGKPAVVLRAGGFLDSTVEGVTGVFIEEQTVESVDAALSALPHLDPDVIKQHAERFQLSVFQSRLREIVEATYAGAQRSTNALD